MNRTAPTKNSPADSRPPLPPRSGEREFAADSKLLRSGSCDAFTRIELIVVAAILVVGIALVLASLPKGKRANLQVRCLNNQKQAGTAFRLFANDYDGKYPFQVLAALDREDPAQVWKLFQAVGEELGSPRLLVCPADAEREAAADFKTGDVQTAESFSHPSRRLKSLSLFIGLDAREDDPNFWVVGDRTLSTDVSKSDSNPGSNLLTGEVVLGRRSSLFTNTNLRWGRSLFDHDLRGNITFSDGHVEPLSSQQLRTNATRPDVERQRLWLPNLPQPKP